MTQPHRLAPYMSSFGFNAFLFERAVGLVPQDKAQTRVHPGTNAFQGLAAHLVIARHGLAQTLGLEPAPLPFSGLGEGFEAGFVETDDFPTLETLNAEWGKLSTLLQERMLSATDEALAQPSPIPIPGLEHGTVLDFVALNVVHEGYHIGQLGLIAKSVTGEPVMAPDAPAPA